MLKELQDRAAQASTQELVAGTPSDTPAASG
jgi:hypothetical protein